MSQHVCAECIAWIYILYYLKCAFADLVVVSATELPNSNVLIVPVDQCQDVGLKLKVIKSGVTNGSLQEILRITQFFPLLFHLLLGF